MIWAPVRTHPLGLFSGLSESLRAMEEKNCGLLTNLRLGTEIVVTSDYAGDHMLYQSLSFLFLSLPGNEKWDQRRAEVRATFLPDSREMNYKDLDHDAIRRNALRPFLNAADEIHGLSISFLINGEIGTCIVDE